jgi:glutamate synthase (NADPH/NADH) large chain
MTGGTVVVLGSTGRNFGAGMSGGVAYLYDRDGDVDRRVNPEMVAIEILTDADRDQLKTLIKRHQEMTGSQTAERMLSSWSVEVSKFRKIMPTDYRRVLEVLESAEREGLSESEAISRVMEAARG